MTRKPKEQGYEGTGMGPGDHDDEHDDQNYESTGLGPNDHGDGNREDNDTTAESEK